jgi:cyclophilin family peptidyl-prolyl cis-trans isomerase
MFRIKLASVMAALAIVVATSLSARQAAAPPATVLVVETVKGSFEIETFPDAPKSVAKIVDLVRTNFYRGLRIHSASATTIVFGDRMSRDMSKMGQWGFTGSGKRVGVKEVSKRAFVRGSVGLYYMEDSKPEDADSFLFVLKSPATNFAGKYAPIGRVPTAGMAVVDKLGHSDVIRNITIKAPAK